MSRSSSGKMSVVSLEPEPATLEANEPAASRVPVAEAKDDLLLVRYDALPEIAPARLPAPRLQLRWEERAVDGFDRICHYEMVLPLREGDMRDDAGTGFVVIELGRTLQDFASPDWARHLSSRVPFRDGVHSRWDAEALGGIPIYVIAPDGTAAKRPALQVGAGLRGSIPARPSFRSGGKRRRIPE